MGWTTPRVLRNATVALAHQTAFESAASSGGTLVRAQCALSELRRGAEYVDQQGTTGSEFPRDTVHEVATRPGATLRFYAGSRPFLAAILEHATHGRPTATLAAGDLVEFGDTAAVLSAWTLAGVRPTFNTDASFRIYVKLEDETPGVGQARVSLYSDSARTALVAQGSAANGNTATLAEQNSSGLSGTVALGTVAASDLTGTLLTVARVRPARSTTIERYFTLFRDSGRELETISGCTVASLALSSEEGRRVQVDVEILGAAYTIGSSVLTAALDSKEYFAHAKTAFSWNAAAQSALSLRHGIRHEVLQSLANADAPAAVWKTGSFCRPLEVVERFADESRTIRNDGVSGSWRAAVATYTFATKSLVFTYPRVRCLNPELPETGERAWADHRLTIEARDDGAQDPVQVSLQL